MQSSQWLSNCATRFVLSLLFENRTPRNNNHFSDFEVASCHLRFFPEANARACLEKCSPSVLMKLQRLFFFIQAQENLDDHSRTVAKRQERISGLPQCGPADCFLMGLNTAFLRGSKVWRVIGFWKREMYANHKYSCSIPTRNNQKVEKTRFSWIGKGCVRWFWWCLPFR